MQTRRMCKGITVKIICDSELESILQLLMERIEPVLCEPDYATKDSKVVIVRQDLFGCLKFGLQRDPTTIKGFYLRSLTKRSNGIYRVYRPTKNTLMYLAWLTKKHRTVEIPVVTTAASTKRVKLNSISKARSYWETKFVTIKRNYFLETGNAW